ncbi:MAG: guanylate kinase [Alloprevotella sp.]|nr:guanylate kinase [Alloprevotella sp.]
MNREENKDFKPGQGRLVIVCAPSGTGKSTIIAHLMQQGLNLHFSISATSRPPRGTEQDGVEYYFISEADFRRRIEAGDFLEYCEVYAGRFYGTLRSEVDRRLEAGENVVLDLDVIGGENIKRIYGDRALSLFIQPPSIAELRRRLESRGTDAPAVIDDRIARAEFELSFAPRFDTVVVNDDLQAAKAEAMQKVAAFLKDSRPVRTALFGGSFNPLHCGHVALAREVLRQGMADEVWLMVSPQNPLKADDGLMAEDVRLALATKALEGETLIRPCDFEFHLPRPSYTWTTLEALRKAYPGREFALLIGGDNAERFDQWAHTDDILRTTRLIVYPRKDTALSPTLKARARQGISLVQAPLLDISSTDIRRRARDGEDLAGLVPEPIIPDVARHYKTL